MKRNALLILGSILFFLPAVASAQHYGPMGPGPGLPGLFQPQRIGQIHEGSVTISAMTGEIMNNHVAGGGLYYSWLMRSTPQFAIGVHVGGSVSPSAGTNYDGYETEVTSGMVGVEARFYIPAGLMDFWISGVAGVGVLSLTEYDAYGDSGEAITYSGGVVGFGAGISYYITPQLSMGGFVRAYRHFFPSDEYVTAPNADGVMEDFTANEYFGIWVVVGGSIAFHY